MTPSQIALVQSSFEKVAPHAEKAASMFYGRLFDIAPQVKPLFKGDIAEQGRKLMAVLAVVVRGLNDLGSVVPGAKALAVRHVAYGVKPDHYPPVGAALIWTLSTALGDDFGKDTEEAWITAYTILSDTMIAEAYGDALA